MVRAEGVDGGTSVWKDGRPCAGSEAVRLSSEPEARACPRYLSRAVTGKLNEKQTERENQEKSPFNSNTQVTIERSRRKGERYRRPSYFQPTPCLITSRKFCRQQSMLPQALSPSSHVPQVDLTGQ